MKNAYRIISEQHGNMKSGIFWCTVLLEHLKFQLSPQKFDRFARFFGCCKTSNIWHQRTRFFTIEAW